MILLCYGTNTTHRVSQAKGAIVLIDEQAESLGSCLFCARQQTTTAVPGTSIIRTRTFVVKNLARSPPLPLLPRAQASEVLRCQRDFFREKLEDESPGCTE